MARNIRNLYSRILTYNGIDLVPASLARTGESEFDMWHIPGREVVSTKELVRRARLHGVPLTKTERVGSRTQIVLIT